VAAAAAAVAAARAGACPILVIKMNANSKRNSQLASSYATDLITGEDIQKKKKREKEGATEGPCKLLLVVYL